jgi:hypothetical protein
MTKTPKNAKSPYPQGNTVPAISAKVAKAEFVKAVSRSKDGANSYVEKFLAVMDMLTGTKSSFTLDDAIYYAQPFELPALETMRLFERWVAMMQSLHKVTVVEGCYQQPVIVLA